MDLIMKLCSKSWHPTAYLLLEPHSVRRGSLFLFVLLALWYQSVKLLSVFLRMDNGGALVTHSQLEAASGVCLFSMSGTSGNYRAVTWLGRPTESKLKSISWGNLPTHPPSHQLTAWFPWWWELPTGNDVTLAMGSVPGLSCPSLQNSHLMSWKGRNEKWGGRALRTR